MTFPKLAPHGYTGAYEEESHLFPQPSRSHTSQVRFVAHAVAALQLSLTRCASQARLCSPSLPSLSIRYIRSYFWRPATSVLYGNGDHPESRDRTGSIGPF
ncbi:hypothetical protein A0H81_10272 [Grifola frondosa]|uniref:Uncharacterized protein n=1 Tax=Grifola frondosa TaxID=5627 RepID=A0A1C7LYW7_GRIFR|nr:hypothetical protein A0H81_10272 [Grifola frondosa]